jgi:hypothetical protein
MKRHLPLAAILVLALASLSIAQEATPSPAPAPKPKAPRVTKVQLQKELVDLETSMWNAWKAKDASVFEKNLSADTVLVDGSGVMNKKSVTGGLTACNISSFSLSDWKMTKLNANAALLTYKGTQSGTCGGTPIPSSVWASSVWVKRKGVWVATFHQETPAM